MKEKMKKITGFLSSFFLLSLFLFPFSSSKTIFAQATPTVYFSAGNPTAGLTITPSAQTCDFVSTAEKNKCQTCILDKGGSWTVFGCLSSSPSEFVASILKFILGIGGGIAFLAMILGGFYLITSAGNPIRINEGKKMIFYSGLGLLMIIFSVFILELVGVQILGIPQYGQ